MRLIELEPKGKHVFIGDTHGDLEASQKIINEYLKLGYTINALGDYVDRGTQSRENIEFWLKTQFQYPNQINLLQGNHETFHIEPFLSSDFWQRLNQTEFDKYKNIFDKLPLAISMGSIIALHGALPDIKDIQEINQIKNGDSNWHKITWGDFYPNDFYWIFDRSRPGFKEDYFKRIMDQIGKKILIRSHQPNCPEKMFDNKCLTIFTSNAYGRERTIAIADFDKKPNIKSIDDLIIKRI